MIRLTTYHNPDDLSNFIELVGDKKLCLMIFSASIKPAAVVLAIEVSMEAFLKLLNTYSVQSFDAEIDHVVTIENLQLPDTCDDEVLFVGFNPSDS